MLRALYHTVLEPCGTHFEQLDEARFVPFCPLASTIVSSMRFHDLWHSAATILFVADVNPKVIQELLGHNKISITLKVYSLVLPCVQQEAASKMDEVFKQS